MKLAGKVALVTGGSGDIGGAIARHLAANGAQVVITYVGAEDAAAATIRDIESRGGRASATQLDQRSPDAIDACIEHVGETLRPARHPGEQRRMEHRHSVSGSRRADERHLGPRARNESARAVPAGARCGATAQGRRRRPHRQHFVGRRHQPGKQQHRVLVEQSGPQPSDALPRRRDGAGRRGELRGAGTGREHADGEAFARRGGKGARAQAVLGRVGQADDIAAQVLTFVTSRSITGQTVVIDGGMPGAMR